MAGSLTFALIWFLVVPMATGLKCFNCDGQTNIGGYDCCVNGAGKQTETCDEAPDGLESKCAKIYGYIPKDEEAPKVIGRRAVPEILAVVGTLATNYLPIVGQWIKRTHLEKKEFVIRGCTQVANSTSNDCSEINYFHTLIGRNNQRCYCDTDFCNGQTTLVSSILFSFLGLLIYYLL